METWHKQLMEVADLQLCRKINGTFLCVKSVAMEYIVLQWKPLNRETDKRDRMPTPD